MVHFPVGVSGWTIFIVGLCVVAYRVHGIDAPRSWIELVERQFIKRRQLQLIGASTVVASLCIMFFGTSQQGVLGWLFILSTTLLFVLGVSLIVAINHVRHFVLATAEADDKRIRIVSIGMVLFGLLWALAPWFL